jgi:hypothetical protein
MAKKIVVEGEPKEVTDIRNKILKEFKNLTFIEEGHKYFLNGQQLPSVSEVTHRFCQYPFNDVEQAERYAEKHGETPQYWLDQWKFTNLKATTTGTLVHSYSESLAWVINGHPEFITEENKCKYIPEKKWLIPTRPKEEAALKFWDETFTKDNVYFVLAETKVYTGKNKQLTNLKQDYAGTFDLLWYYKHPTDDSKSGLIILDYKTNGSLTNDFSRSANRYFAEPFGDLYDEALSNYKLQLSAYQLPLEDIGLKVIGRRIIWLKGDGNYEIVPIDDYTERLREIL